MEGTRDERDVREVKAVVFSKFPARYFQETLQPGLEKLGVKVIRVLSPEKAEEADLAKADSVIAMRDLMSGLHKNKIKHLARRSGRKYYELTRHKSLWPQVLEIRDYEDEGDKEEVQVAATKSVRDEDIEPMLAEYVRLDEAGSDEEEMVRGMARFWTGRPLTNWHQLNGYVSRLVQAGRAPGEFREWWKARESREPKKTSSKDPVQRPDLRIVKDPPREAGPADPGPNQGRVPGPERLQASMSEDEIVAWLDQLEQEKAAEIGEIQERLKEAEEELSALRKENERLRSSGDGRVPESIQVLAKAAGLGLMTWEEAFGRLAKVYGKA